MGKVNFRNININNNSLFADDELKLAPLYIKLFKSVPSKHVLNAHFDFAKCEQYFKTAYEECQSSDNQIFYTSMKSSRGSRVVSKSPMLDGSKMILLLKKDLLVCLENRSIELYYNPKDKEEIDDVSAELLLRKKPKKKKKSNNFYMVTYSYSCFDLEKFKLPKFNYDIESCYNDDFTHVDKRIVNFLGDKNRNGLILLHGLSGTGKTTYIRYLISIVKMKFIFLPLHMADSLSNPEFLPFLVQHKNAILIIEDCEQLIIDREHGNSSAAIATLLNLSDGLLSNALGIKLVCTFNTNISKIDKALTRKGRMVTRYEFKELNPEKALALSEKHNLKYDGVSPIKVSDLFNSEDNNHSDQQKSMGFKR